VLDSPKESVVRASPKFAATFFANPSRLLAPSPFAAATASAVFAIAPSAVFAVTPSAATRPAASTSYPAIESAAPLWDGDENRYHDDRRPHRPAELFAQERVEQSHFSGVTAERK